MVHWAATAKICMAAVGFFALLCVHAYLDIPTLLTNVLFSLHCEVSWLIASPTACSLY